MDIKRINATALRIASLTLALVVGAGPASASNYFKGDARSAAIAQLEQIKAVQARNEKLLFGVKGVFAVGISLDRATGSFALHVETEDLDAAQGIASEIEGIPVVIKKGVAPVPAGGGSACMPCHANQLTLPVEPGNSGKTDATCGACTIGFKACDLQSGNSVLVTNAHCATDTTTCPGSAAIGASAFHVSPLDGPSCSTATSNVGSVAQHAAPVCGGAGSTVDATSINSTSGQSQLSIRDIGVPSAYPGAALPGDEVQKSGRTTGLTTGVVDAINVTVNVSYNCCGAISMIQQIRVNDTTGDIFCWGGDSGSGLLNYASPPEIVGLVFARNGDGTTCWANDIANVTASLGLSLNHLDCIDDPCAANDAADATNDPQRARAALYALRDNVLGQSELGKTYIRTFYAITASWVALYALNPELLEETGTALQANMDVVEAIAGRRPITTSKTRIKRLSILLTQHMNATQDPSLRQAFSNWRRDINDSSVRQQFGVSVR